MIRRLRWKFVAVIMGVVCLFLIGILSGLYIAAKTSTERMCDMVLRQSVDRNTMFRGRGSMYEGFPVTVLSVDPSGTISIVENQIHYIEDGDIPRIIEQIDAQGTETGAMDDNSLRYLVMTMGGGEKRYALIDTYASNSSLRTLAYYAWAIGLGAAALFFGVSLLLSRWLVGPVEAAWNRQRQFVADASHELKTPLTVVLSNTDMLIASDTVAGDRNISRLDNIKAESQRMRGLIEDLLTLARSDSGDAMIKREEVSFSYIVSYSVLTLEPTIYDMGRTIESSIADDQMVVGDADKLRQLVDILLDNANKYGLPGSPIDVKLEPSGKREILFSVKSEGTPIPSDELSSIFQRFYRSDRSRGMEKGYGLGLSIAENIVKEHNGRIWAQTDGVTSNTFFVRLNSTVSPSGEK